MQFIEMTMNEQHCSSLPSLNCGCRPEISDSINQSDATSLCDSIKTSVNENIYQKLGNSSNDPNMSDAQPLKIRLKKPRHVRSHSDCTGLSSAGLSHQAENNTTSLQKSCDNKDTDLKPTRPRFLDDGGSSITIASAGHEYPKRQRGQSLVDYLLSNHTGKIGPELDRENAHFSVSEAMIAAIEEARFYDWSGQHQTVEDYDILINDVQDDSDEEIREISSQLKIALRVSKMSTDPSISPTSSIATITPPTSPSGSLVSNADGVRIRGCSSIDPTDSGISFTSLCSAFEKERQKSRKLARLKRAHSCVLTRGGSFYNSEIATTNPSSCCEVFPSTERRPTKEALSRALFSSSIPSPIRTNKISISTSLPLPSSSESVVSAESIALSLLGHFSELQVPVETEMEWLVSEKDAPQHLLPMPKSWPINPDDPFMQLKENDTEEINITNLRGNAEWAPPRPQIVFALYSSPNLKVLMAKQNYRCAGCGMKVMPEYSHNFRYCNYLGRYFCTACHSNKTFVIPSRIFKKWDFRKYPVSNFSFDLLERMWFDPLFRLGYINPLLYRRCRQLSKVLELRLQLVHVAEFLRACRFADEIWESVKHEANDWLEDPELYSLHDITRVNSGELFQILRGIVTRGMGHILSCELCKARGFFCEVCRSSEVIFPFQVDTVIRCAKCGSCYHRPCWTSTNCPRCQRIARRSQGTPISC